MAAVEDFSNDHVFSTGLTLHIDADSIVFAECCIFNEDTEAARTRISRGIRRRVMELMLDAGCDDYICFLTTKTNFRNQLTDDYKANRKDTERPVNLAWAKRWTATNLSCIYEDGLEADDLLGIHMSDAAVIWSIDKDLRQIPGKHLDDSTRKVIHINYLGKIVDLGKKIYFTGEAGLLFQILTGDSTDYIVGCGKRETVVYKSGPKKGEEYVKRNGVGPKEALDILVTAAVKDGDPRSNMMAAVIAEYEKLHGSDWRVHLETQANLLFMVREKHGRFIRRWTCDGRVEYFDILAGIITDELP